VLLPEPVSGTSVHDNVRYCTKHCIIVPVIARFASLYIRQLKTGDEIVSHPEYQYNFLMNVQGIVTELSLSAVIVICSHG
jgi:hypothetical protein